MNSNKFCFVFTKSSKPTKGLRISVILSMEMEDDCLTQVNILKSRTNIKNEHKHNLVQKLIFKLLAKLFALLQFNNPKSTFIVFEQAE